MELDVSRLRLMALSGLLLLGGCLPPKRAAGTSPLPTVGAGFAYWHEGPEVRLICKTPAVCRRAVNALAVGPATEEYFELWIVTPAPNGAKVKNAKTKTTTTP